MKRFLESKQQPEEAKRQRVEEEPMGSFDALDTNLIVDILSRLSPADIVLRAGRVCKKWHCLAHSKRISQLSRERSAGNFWLSGAQPWIVVELVGVLLFFDSVNALLNRRGRQLDERSISFGPAGHKFDFVACSLGLVCGKLVDLDEPGSDAITLAVGNPLTNEWRTLPRVNIGQKAVDYTMTVWESGSYYVRIHFPGPLIMEYRSETQVWEPAEGFKFKADDLLFFRGYSLKEKDKFRMFVEWSVSERNLFSLNGTQIFHQCQPDRGKFTSISCVLRGVNSIAISFVPTLATP